MKISDFSLTRLRNEEHFQFQTSFKDLVLTTTATTLRIEALFAVFLTQYDNELLSLNVVRKNAISDDLADSDEERDNVFRGMCDAVKSGLNHYQVLVQEACRRLQILLDTYGNVAVKSYDAETAAINGLIADLKGTYAIDVAAAGLDGWVTELEAKNKAFNELKTSRYTEEAQKTCLRMKQERAKLDAVYRQIVERINALIIVEGESAWVTFVNELNKRVESYSNVIAIRRGKAQKASDAAAAQAKA